MTNYEQPEAGRYYLCKSVFNENLQKTDIFCKVLHTCKRTKTVYIMRVAEYGFKALTATTMSIEQFKELYTIELPD